MMIVVVIECGATGPGWLLGEGPHPPLLGSLAHSLTDWWPSPHSIRFEGWWRGYGLPAAAPVGVPPVLAASRPQYRVQSQGGAMTTQHLRRAQAARASSSSSSAGVVEGESWASEEVLSKLEPLIRAMEGHGHDADLSPLAHHCNPLGGHCKCLARWLGPEAEQRCQHLRELEQQDRDNTATADEG